MTTPTMSTKSFEMMTSTEALEYHKNAINRGKYMLVDYLKNHRYNDDISNYIVSHQPINSTNNTMMNDGR